MQWFESHSGILDAIRADDAQRLSAGTKWTVLATVCAKYQEDVATLTAALPVPNAVVDAGFRQAVNLLRGGVSRCISSASSESYSGYTIASEQYLNPGIIAFMNAEAYRTQQRLPT